ncbi:hypothetical protein J2802_002852 [Paraburkholderia caribensis]|nr:hypothetical protein [Paraburkholderia caribensis]
MWLTGRLSPYFKTIADFRRNNGKAIRHVRSRFIVLCRNLDLFSKSIVAIDGSKFKAVTNRDRNFTSAKVKARLQQIDESGYDVQTAVDDTHHLIVAHEVTNIGNDRGQLTNMAGQARAATGIKELTVMADRGYFKSEEVLQCHEAGITAFVPKPLTSGKSADGYFGTQDFIYIAKDDEYLCPAQQRLSWRFTNIEHGMTLHCYSRSACSSCAIRKQCISGKQARR